RLLERRPARPGRHGVTSLADDLHLALEMADLADSLTLPHFRDIDLAVDTKPDLTPVTDVDRGVEWALREFVEKRRPGDAVVAEGACDVGLDPEVSVWDLAALKVIVEEAGGRFTDLDGRARADGGSAVSTNGLLHADVLRTLKP